MSIEPPARSLTGQQSIDYDSIHFSPRSAALAAYDETSKTPPKIELPVFLDREVAGEEESFLLSNLADLIISKDLLTGLTSNSIKELFLLICYNGEAEKLSCFHESGGFCFLKKAATDEGFLKIIKDGFFEIIKVDHAVVFDQLRRYFPDHLEVQQLYEQAQTEKASEIISLICTYIY